MEAMAMPRLFCLLSTALLTPACITPDEFEAVPPDTPITLYRAASEVLGRQTEAVLVETENTLADFPLEA